jgi:hypothetical protein
MVISKVNKKLCNQSISRAVTINTAASQKLVTLFYSSSRIQVSIADPWHFGTDPDPYLWLKDSAPAPDPAIFVSDIQGKNSFFSVWYYYYFLKVHLYHFSKIKCHKEVTKQLESRFFLFFLLDDRMDPDPDP